MKSATKNIALSALFCALIALGAFIKIPTPLAPVTLQVTFCLLACLLLGPKRSLISVAVYILAGLIGLPVFTEGGGIFYVFKPTFGYLIGFAVGVFVGGIIARGFNMNRKISLARLIAGGTVALVIIYAIGVAYMYVILNYYLAASKSFWQVALFGCAIFLPVDAASVFACAFVARRVIPALNCNNLACRDVEFSRAEKTLEDVYNERIER